MNKQILDDDLFDDAQESHNHLSLKLTAVARYVYIGIIGVIIFNTIRITTPGLKDLGNSYSLGYFLGSSFIFVLIFAMTILYLNYHLKQANQEIRGINASQRVSKLAMILATILNLALLVIIIQMIWTVTMSNFLATVGMYVWCISLLHISYRDIQYLFQKK